MEYDGAINEQGSNFGGSKKESMLLGPNVPLCIPISGGLPIEIKQKDLANKCQDIVAALIKHKVKLKCWLQFAVAYYRQGYYQDFLDVLLSAMNAGFENDPWADEDKEMCHCMLAAYYTRLAQTQATAKEKKKFITAALREYDKSMKLNQQSESVHVGQSIAEMLNNKREEAREALELFNMVKKGPGVWVPALVVEACIQFHKGQFKEALRTLRRALEAHPDQVSGVRLAIGLCQYKMGNTEQAKDAFSRVLEMDHANVTASVNLAILLLNDAYCNTGNSESPSKAIADEDRNRFVRRSVELAGRAYELDSACSPALNILAEHFFFQKDLTLSEKFSQKSIQSARFDEVHTKSAALYLLGRCQQCKSDFSAAYESFSEAIKLDPNNSLALYGLGQMHSVRGEVTKAITCFESVLRKFPNNVEAMRSLAVMHAFMCETTGDTGGEVKAEQDHRQLAIGLFKQLLELFPDDYEMLVRYGQLNEKSNPEMAFQSYRSAIKIMTKGKKEVPIELYNNTGAICHILGYHNRAERYYHQALELDEGDEVVISRENVSVVYNLARLQEVMRNFQKASKLYKEILKEHPNYVDCYMRLGCIARDSGNTFEAGQWFKEVLTVNTKCLDMWALLGNLHMAKDEWRPAQNKFETMIKICKEKGIPPDPYAQLSMGNIYYNASFQSSKSSKYLKLATDYYLSVLKVSPNNAYAANGLAGILAEKDQLSLAKDYMLQVRESVADMPSVWVNLAHVYMAQGQFVNAAKMYQNCLKKFYDNHDVPIFANLARTYYEMKRFDEARKVILKAIHIDPSSLHLRFLLALCQQDNAMAMLEKSRKSISDIKTATEQLEQARRIFKELSTSSKSPTALYSRTSCGVHADFCAKTLEKTQSYLDQAKREEEEDAKRKEERARIIRELEEKREKERREQQKREEEEEEIGRQRIAEMKERLQKLDFSAASSMAKKRKRQEEEDADYASEPDEGEVRRRKLKRKKEEREQYSTGESDFEDDGPTGSGAIAASVDENETWDGSLNKLKKARKAKEEGGGAPRKRIRKVSDASQEASGTDDADNVKMEENVEEKLADLDEKLDEDSDFF
mmetsp:Transcript_20069/g.56404  ORF Transcript_20069/g.56404 Transcript_20069/m.56404 type:complete len:1084 (-) Transcript_20069:395-3646(-)